MTRNRGILVYNPTAHGGKFTNKIVKSVEEVYRSNNKELSLHQINPKGNGFGNLAAIVRQYKSDHIIIAGGDGTLNKYVNYAYKNSLDLPIGIVPAGTANDLAGSLGITQNIEKILQGDIKNIDIGEIDYHGKNEGKIFFVNVFSFGYLTCVSHTTAEMLKKAVGPLAYFIHGTKEAISPKREEIRLTSKTINYSGKVLLILVLNGKTAGGMTFADTADLQDGLLDVCIFKGDNIGKTLSAAINVLQGKGVSKSSGVIYGKSSEISIESTFTQTDVDGDPGPDFPLTIKTIQGGLKIII